MPTLIISEKNKAAKAIAEALGPVKSIKKSNFLYIYYVKHNYEDIYIIPLRGHILGYKNSDEFKSWTKSTPRAIITDPNSIKKIPENYAYPYINALKEYSKICHNCIIGTDADIEGCNIGLFDALPFVKQANSNINVSQMWLSSLQKNEILKKFNNRISPKWSWGETGEARAIIDAIIGFSATRELTNTLRPLLEKIDRQFVSIGRVQTSLLYLIYLRDQRIKNFIPEPYFTIEANLNNQNSVIKAYHDLNPFKKEQEIIAKAIYRKIKDEKLAKIIKNTKNTLMKHPPAPLNTSKALMLLTKNLKISANLAFNTMNQLYLNKIISYPRTDSDIYKNNFNHLQYLKKFASNLHYGKYTTKLLNENRFNPTRGKMDAGDHPPITPLESLEFNNPKFENDIQRKVYDILARHYLALFGKNVKETKTVLKLSIKSEPFTSRFVSLIDEGFFEIAPFLKKGYDNEVNILGNEISIQEIDYNNKKTQPPPNYTDTTLLKLMEKYNLGTKSTRPIIIKLLQNRELIFHFKRKYSTTELGSLLIEHLKDIWLPFLDPKFTYKIEVLLDDIKEKRKKKEDVIRIVKKDFLNLFDKFLIKKNKLLIKMGEFEKKNIRYITHKKSHNKYNLFTTSKCPVCKTYPMKLVKTKKKTRFLVCSKDECRTYLSIPRKGKITILKSTICSICGFNVSKINLRNKNKVFSYYICLKCWNDGLKDKSEKRGFCSNCKNYKIINNKCRKK
ncbi:MAG: DNA topoisomerase [Promethearchaeota archaeon]